MKQIVSVNLMVSICACLTVPFFAGCDAEAKKQRAAVAAELREDVRKRDAWYLQSQKPRTNVNPNLGKLH